MDLAFAKSHASRILPSTVPGDGAARQTYGFGRSVYLLKSVDKRVGYF